MIEDENNSLNSSTETLMKPKTTVRRSLFSKPISMSGFRSKSNATDEPNTTKAKPRSLSNTFLFALVLIIGAGTTYFLKNQSEQIDQLTRLEELQKVEIQNFRKQLKTLTDHELQEKSKQDATAVANQKLASNESTTAFNRELEKLKTLLVERQTLGDTSSLVESSAQNPVSMPTGLHPLQAEGTSRSLPIKGVVGIKPPTSSASNRQNGATEPAHSTFNQRHLDRLSQIKVDQIAIHDLSQKIHALSKRRKNKLTSGELAKLDTNLNQYQLDITNLKATDQSDQDNFNRNQLAVSALDEQIKKQEAVVQELQAKAQIPATNPSTPTETGGAVSPAAETHSAPASSGSLSSEVKTR